MFSSFVWMVNISRWKMEVKNAKLKQRKEKRSQGEKEKTAALALASPAVGGVCCCVASGDEAAMPPCWLKDVMNLQSGAFLPG